MKSNFFQLWGWPLVMAILTIFGLLAALTGTGVWHWLSWIALSVPVVTMVVFLFKKRVEKE
ncbi:hypothetical protein SAMN04488505_1198 [Chitinophaga rupis]|uniref:Uncharacterized protein n=1 Tax=Chitinophaga rupis TaxID=573321 RepID=A0A1H8KPP9_9BACT|nr:hypothetical protein [Chitinophaga rupis]SEN94893.1 hypothetical protein SAMN04488505_1198 [Chitinophaga rupis]